MKEYAAVLVIAMPLFLALILIEKLYGYFKGEDTAPIMDSVSSISSGIINSLKDVLGLSVTLLSYEWMSQHLALFQQEITITSIIIAFIAIDFYGYWSHRLAHQINFFWNKHAIHHSSEEFNLSCALRQSISSFVNLFTFLLIPAALLGVPAKVIAITLPIHLFLQFWYHTKHIKKLGLLEQIIVTPSHHRVHHAINSIYIDGSDNLYFTGTTSSDDLPVVNAYSGSHGTTSSDDFDMLIGKMNSSQVVNFLTLSTSACSILSSLEFETGAGVCGCCGC